MTSILSKISEFKLSNKKHCNQIMREDRDELRKVVLDLSVDNEMLMHTIEQYERKLR